MSRRTARRCVLGRGRDCDPLGPDVPDRRCDYRSRRMEAFRGVILAAVETQVDFTLVELSEMLPAPRSPRDDL
jgi:hypothetical protein